MRIFILHTNMFPEKAAVEDAIAYLAQDHELIHLDTARVDLTDKNWDEAVNSIVAVDRVLTL